MGKFIITEEEKKDILGLYEQSSTVPFYSFLISKGYKQSSDWTDIDDQELYKEIKGLSSKLNLSQTVLFINSDKGVVPIKLVTDGSKVYFIGNFYPSEVANKIPNPKGPFVINDIKKYL